MLRLATFFGILFALAWAQAPGTNYQTGDGQIRQESVDSEGNVRGQYSYVDPNGKTITVKYTAGKNGFQVEGDHIPRGQDASSLPTAPEGQPGSAPPQLPAGFNPQSLFAAAPNGLGQPATPSQLTQFAQIPQGPIQGQPAAVQFSQIPTPSRFTPPLTAPQVGAQQYSTSPAQFPQTPQSASVPSFPAGQFPSAPQYNFPQLTSGQAPPQFPASLFSGFPSSLSGGSQQSLQFPGTPQLSQFSSLAAGASPNSAQLSPVQFPSAPASAALNIPPSSPQFTGSPAGTQFISSQNPNFAAATHRFN